jgi:hypothetical protein
MKRLGRKSVLNILLKPAVSKEASNTKPTSNHNDL